MRNSESLIQGVDLFQSKVFADNRGIFYEGFSSEQLAEQKLDFLPKQMNISVSQKNVLRGIHFSLNNHKQRKLLNCVSGKILDILIDLRMESPTFLKIEKFELSGMDGKCLYIPSGVGHSFLALENETKIVYLMDSQYKPQCEYTISPFSPEFVIDWPKVEFIQSERDREAPTWGEFKKTRTQVRDE